MISIIGSGLVGSAVANALAFSELILNTTPIYLFDRDEALARAQAEDVRLAAIALGRPIEVRLGNDNDLAASGVVVIAPGLRQKLGLNLNELLENNTQTIRGIIRQLETINPTAVRIVATQPVDVMTEVARAETAPERRSRLFGVGTALETIHLRHAIAHKLGIHPRHVHGSVIGEAGTGAVVLWSSVNVAGFPLAKYCTERGIAWHRNQELAIEDEVRRASQRIEDGKAGSGYGIGATIARLAAAVIYDQRRVFTVSARTNQEVALSLPHVIGKDGILDTLTPPLTGQELHKLEASANSLRETLARL
jgi:L-lactate dehydrogenase